jgi:tRNA A58 N-methylase Trm61
MWIWLISAGLGASLCAMLLWSWWPSATKVALEGAKEANKVQNQNVKRLELDLKKEWNNKNEKNVSESNKVSDYDSAFEFLQSSFSRRASASTSSKP